MGMKELKRAKLALDAKLGLGEMEVLEVSNSHDVLLKKKPKFEEEYRRVTSYLHVDNQRRLEKLREWGSECKLTHILNKALEEYTIKKYGEI